MAAVVGIVGTTEEGAVDPIHEIVEIRRDFEGRRNRSFWFHLDAAWGGYVRTIFLTDEDPPRFRDADAPQDDAPRDHAPQDDPFREILGRLRLPIQAMSRSDSTTIDPHKLGYVPYPAGMVAFPDNRVKALLWQRAPYIADGRTDAPRAPGADTERETDDGIGTYILEGSKPGAAALACWLAHETIPLDESGHGQLIRTTLCNARALFDHLAEHRARFADIHRAAFENVESVDTRRRCLDPFAFLPLHQPDTNIVCFIARPMVWRGDDLAFRDLPLKWTNVLNERIWRATSIDPSARSPNGPRPAAQPFFVSRTRFEVEQYSAETVGTVLKKIGATESEYRRHQLFVLRSVVMNPWHDRTKAKGKDHLLDFVHHLHRAAADAMGAVLEAAEREERQPLGPPRPPAATAASVGRASPGRRER